ncbi:LytTR family DNA-binding domain-containing protein [Gilvimarinus sp. DA14]|uniref:LytR/AlgR family response regulator transcription factor n=1 Tax=Gilvimarinus sp. DA14 TaxID=2956798 RepID=UPI0020B886D3|nr:LytTR family DNA-binding domain-containing protein [Gilvimarinus sp. DA14]UTF59007.1 LytTR family transcriptional regulator [Gilvimarinus sp. DA14]
MINNQGKTQPATRERIKRHFLAHPRLWSTSLVLIWALLNTALLATTAWMEAQRMGKPLPLWEPICWEATSIFMIVLCIWPIAWWIRFLQSRYSLGAQLAFHGAALVLFSVVHVGGMVGLRILCYRAMGSHYDFGDPAYEFLYEFRKDAMSYLTLVVVISGYQFIARRLQGEASYVDESEQSSAPLPDRLLVRKLGKEFLINVADIEWVEASGNYANLHLGSRVYPMRITMAKLERQLPCSLFKRIHRSFIVNLSAVDHLQPTEFGDYVITLKSGANLPLSRRYRDDFRAAMQ